jgi:hypothetical protein
MATSVKFALKMGFCVGDKSEERQKREALVASAHWDTKTNKVQADHRVTT